MQVEDQGATPEVEQVTDQVVEQVAEPKSMDDTIRDTLRELQAKDTTNEAPASTLEEKAQRVRDQSGKFAAKESPATPVVPDVPAEPVEQVPVRAAPNTWRKEVADKWASLPPEVQAEVERREADFHKGIEGYREKAQFGDAMHRAIAPHAETLRSLNVTADRAISELMQADHILRFGQPQEKQQYFAQLAQSYGIDLGQVQAMPAIDPHVSAMQQRIAQLEGTLQNQSLMGQQAEQEALNSEISRFASDPSHSHFEILKGHMVALLQAGQAKDLADAYEQASFANPTTRAAVLAKQQAAEREAATKKAQAAKAAASVNVRTRPSMPVSQPIGSMDETIRATLRKLQNA